MARQLGISRPPVYALLRRGTPLAPRSPQRSGQVLRPSLPYLIRRWRESITDSMRLWREIQALGYTHSACTVCHFITQWRRAISTGLTLEGNNGVTEGQIHRLKLVKRQGYGRHGFALVRQRVLQAA